VIVNLLGHKPRFVASALYCPVLVVAHWLHSPKQRTAMKGTTVATTRPNKRERIVRNIGTPICARRAFRAGVPVLIVRLVFGKFYGQR
jgi:hypothetical protein